MTIYNEGVGGREEKNEGTLDGIEENGMGEGGGRKDSRTKQYYPMHMYDYMNGVNLHHVQP